MQQEVPILGSVSYGRHFVDLEGYGAKDYNVPSYTVIRLPRRLPYGEDIIEKLLECGDEPVMGRDGEIRLAVRMPNSDSIVFYTRREICEKLPSRKQILAEATGQLERTVDGNFGLVVKDNYIWIGRCDDSLPTKAKLALLVGDVQITALLPEGQAKEHSFIRIEKANGQFGSVADLMHLDQAHKSAIINGIRLRKSGGD